MAPGKLITLSNEAVLEKTPLYISRVKRVPLKLLVPSVRRLLAPVRRLARGVTDTDTHTRHTDRKSVV